MLIKHGLIWITSLFILLSAAVGATAADRYSKKFFKMDSVLITSSTPSRLVLKPDGRNFTLTLKGVGLDKISDVRVVSSSDAEIPGIKVVDQNLSKYKGIFTFAADRRVKPGDYRLLVIADKKKVKVPSNQLQVIVDPKMASVALDGDYDIRIRVPLQLRQISSEVVKARVSCNIKAPGNAFIGSGKKDIELTNGSFNGIVDVDCLVGEDFLPQDAAGWSCTLSLAVPDETMGLKYMVPSQAALNPTTGKATLAWARAADKTPFTKRMHCTKKTNVDNPSLTNPATTSCGRQP